MDSVFDILAYTRRLKAAGLEEALAEAHAEALRAAFSEGGATKAGERDTRSDARELGYDLAGLGTRVECAINRILLAVIALGGVVVAVGSVIVVAVIKLPK